MTDYALLSAEELAAMTRAERAAYYMALYQQAGAVAVGLIPNDEITLPMADENQRGFKTYSAKECGQSSWHIGEGNDHAYQNREKRNRTRGAKRAAWRQLAGGEGV